MASKNVCKIFKPNEYINNLSAKFKNKHHTLILITATLPDPGGPHRMSDVKARASMIALSALPLPSTCSCPTNSPRHVGRTRSAKGPMLNLRPRGTSFTPTLRAPSPGSASSSTGTSLDRLSGGKPWATEEGGARDCVARSGGAELRAEDAPGAAFMKFHSLPSAFDLWDASGELMPEIVRMLSLQFVARSLLVQTGGVLWIEAWLDDFILQLASLTMLASVNKMSTNFDNYYNTKYNDCL